MKDSERYPPQVGQNEEIAVKRFDLKLPLFPGQEEETVIKMDGKELRGVTGLVIKADSQGFTNAVIEFEAAVAIEMVAALIPKIQKALPHENDLDDVLGVELEKQLNLNGHGIIPDPDGDESAVDYEAVGKAFRICLEQLMKSL